MNTLLGYGITRDLMQRKLREHHNREDIFLAESDFSSNILHLRKDPETKIEYEIHGVKVKYRMGADIIEEKYIAKTRFHPREEFIYALGLETIPEKKALVVTKRDRPKKGTARVLFMADVGDISLEQIILTDYPGIRDIFRQIPHTLAYTHKKISDMLKNLSIRKNTKKHYASKFESHITPIIDCHAKKSGNPTFLDDNERNEFFRKLSFNFEFIGEAFERGTLIKGNNGNYEGTQLVIGHTDLHPGHIYSKKFNTKEKIEWNDLKIIDFRPGIIPWYFDFVDVFDYPSTLKNIRFTEAEIKYHLKEYLINKARVGEFVQPETRMLGIVPTTTRFIIPKEFEEDVFSMYQLSSFARSIRGASKALLMKKLFSNRPEIYERFYSQKNPLYKHHPAIYLLNARDQLKAYARINPKANQLIETLGEKIHEFRDKKTLDEYFSDINGNKCNDLAYYACNG